jgi:Flp pilus assembly protein TadD
MNISAPIETDERVEAAARLVVAKRHAEAESLLQAVLRQEPGHPDALNTLASIALARGDGKRALEILAPTCSAYPDHARLISNLGLAHFMLGRPEDAVICLQRAVALAPDEASHRLSLAQLLAGAGDFDRAINELETILADEPRNARALAQLGVALMGANELDRAERALRQAAEADPDEADTLYNLSILCIHAGRNREAAVLAERAHLRAPLEFAKQLQLARCRALLGEFEAAEELCKRVLVVAQDNLSATELFGRIAIARGAVSSGITTLSDFVRRHPKDPDAILALAGVLRFAGRIAQAEAMVDQALALVPGHVSGLRLRYELLLTQGRFSEAWKSPAPRSASDSRRVAALKGTSAIEAVLFSRFLADVAPEGAVLVSGAGAQIDRLLRHAQGVSAFEGSRDGAQEALLLQGLPAALGVDRARIISGFVPYLTPDPARRERWRKAFADLPRPLVGVAWDEYPPGVLMRMVAPLAETAGTAVSVVSGEARHQLRDWPKAIDAGAHFDDPAEMIAAISCLDAIIGVDCLPLHLAGALGIPGMALAAAGAPWYLAAEAGDSIWYPSLRILRQAKPGNWNDALQGAAEALGQLAPWRDRGALH